MTPYPQTGKHCQTKLENYGIYSAGCKDIKPLKINMEHNHGGLEDDFPL